MCICVNEHVHKYQTCGQLLVNVINYYYYYTIATLLLLLLYCTIELPYIAITITMPSITITL